MELILARSAWRPIRVVENAPLVLCDRRSVRKRELIEVDKVLPDKVEQAFFIHHNKDQKWYYLSRQAPEEVTLFVSWRPEGDGDIAGGLAIFLLGIRKRKLTDFYLDYSPHGASSAEATGTKPRESIEVRMIIFIPKNLE